MSLIRHPRDALKQNTFAYDAFTNSMTYVVSELKIGQVHLKTDLRDMLTATARMSYFWGKKPEEFDGYHHTNMVRTLEQMDMSDKARLHWIDALNAFYQVSSLTERKLIDQDKFQAISQPELWRDYLTATLDVLVERFNPTPKLDFDDSEDFNLG